MDVNDRRLFKDIGNNLNKNTIQKLFPAGKLPSQSQLDDSGICLREIENENDLQGNSINETLNSNSDSLPANSTLDSGKENENVQPAISLSANDKENGLFQEKPILITDKEKSSPVPKNQINISQSQRTSLSIVKVGTLINDVQVVYKITCIGCDKAYIGQTEDSLKKVMKDFERELIMKIGMEGRLVIQHYNEGQCKNKIKIFEILEHEPVMNHRIQAKRKWIEKLETCVHGLNLVLPKIRNVNDIPRTPKQRKITSYFTPN